MKWFVRCFRHYADFRGRAPLPEFWYFMLFLMLSLFLVFAVTLGAVSLSDSGSTVGRYLAFIVGLPFLLPCMAVMVRRLHDCGRSGWWVGGYLAVSIAGYLLRYASRKPDGAAWLMDADLAVAILQGAYLILLLYCLCQPGGRTKINTAPVRWRNKRRKYFVCSVFGWIIPGALLSFIRFS